MWFSTFWGAGSQCVPRRPHGLTSSLGSCDQGHTVENPCWQAHTVWPSLSMRVAQATPRTLVDGKIVPRPSRGCPGTKSILFHGILMEKRWVFDPRPCCCCWSWTIIVIFVMMLLLRMVFLIIYDKWLSNQPANALYLGLLCDEACQTKPWWNETGRD